MDLRYDNGGWERSPVLVLLSTPSCMQTEYHSMGLAVGTVSGVLYI